MKMKKLIIFLLASTFSLTALAQLGKSSTRQQCTSRCISADAEHPQKTQSEARLVQIRAKKKVETDSTKLKELETAEQLEVEKHQENLEQLCRKACASNPEE
jgi:hypothetical protein